MRYAIALLILGGIALGIWCGTLDSRLSALERPLSTSTPILVRHVDASGTTVAPDETMPLWEYVETPDRTTAVELQGFERAFEFDLHNGDKSFHLTHEFIDRKTWD